MDHLRIQESLQSVLKDALNKFECDNGVGITHNFQVYASNRGMYTQIQIFIRDRTDGKQQSSSKVS